MIQSKNIYSSFIILLLLLSTNAIEALTLRNSPLERTYKEHVYFNKKNSSEFKVTHKGEIIINEQDNGIASITPNGYLIIEQKSFGNTRKLEIRANNTGKLARTYSEGKSEKEFANEGKEWFASLMPDLIYQTAIGGAERVIQIYNKHGIRKALEEAEKLRSEGKNTSIIISGLYHQEIKSSQSNRYLYYKALVDKIQFTEDELSEYIDAIASIKSNSNKGSILRIILDKYKLTPNLMESFLETTSTLDYNTERGNTLRVFISKYDINKDNYKDFFRVIDGMNINSEKGNLIKAILNKQTLDDNVFIALLQSVGKFTNNSEKAAVLRKALYKLPKNDVVTKLFISTNNSMSSAYRYLKEEINNMLLDNNSFKNKNISKELMLQTINNVLNERANTKKSTTLRKLHASLSNDPELLEAYFRVVESMERTVEAYNLVLEFTQSIKLNNVSYILVLNAAEEIAKDNNMHGASAILRTVIPSLPDNDKVMAQFFDAFEEIDHNSAREEIIRLLAQHKKINGTENIFKLLKIASEIDMDIEKALSLKYIAKNIPKNNKEALFLYKRLADEIESNYEYKRANSL